MWWVERSGSVGRALDCGTKGCWFETQRQQSQSVVSLSKTLYLLLSTGSTQEDMKLSQHDWKIVDWDVKHQNEVQNQCDDQNSLMILYIDNSLHVR